MKRHPLLRRLLKVVVGALVAVVVLVTAGVLSIWGMYRHVVDAEPGALAVHPPVGPLGAKVNPFVATGGIPMVCGYDSPAATTPFGMVRLGPDTASLLINKTGLNRAGYFYGDNKIIGFSHTRLVGADALEGGLFRVFPTIQSHVAADRRKDRATPFSHSEEKAVPGYYAVRLPREGVLAELTATPRVGVHRYTFSKAETPHILIDVTSALGNAHCTNGVVKVLPETHEVEGSTRLYGTFSGRYGGLDAYFVARFDRPFSSYGTWTGDTFKNGKTDAAGNDVGADLAFKEAGGKQTIELRLALSYVSIHNARLNLEAEAANRSFDAIAAAASDAWEKRLSCIQVQGGTPREQRIFYTALYHAFQMPTVFSDVNGEYTGFDRAVHKADGFRYYTDFSLWDTFRTVEPLYSLVARKAQRDMMNSLVAMAKEGGCLPRWPSGCGYTGSMLGTPADIVVSEAYQKGIRGFDVNAAYQAMRQTALTGPPKHCRFHGRKGLKWYLKYGYCPTDKMSEGVASTLEYAHEDYAISRLAGMLGHEKDAELFATRAQNYRHLWNPATQFFETKDSAGHFPKVRDPLVLSFLDPSGKYTRGYVEGSGMQWRWSVPYDATGLIGLFKSRSYFVRQLNTFFAKANPNVGTIHPGPYYWQGNEPDIHAVYLFNDAGRPDLTQKWARWIMDHKYSDDYVGLDGNDDGGTLSAWYVLSALGFYPVAGTTKYELGSPLFAKAEVHIGDKVLTIIAENNRPKNVYVQQVSLNGKPLAHPWFTHDEIAQGGTLRFKMSATPAPIGRP